SPVTRPVRPISFIDPGWQKLERFWRAQRLVGRYAVRGESRYGAEPNKHKQADSGPTRVAPPSRFLKKKIQKCLTFQTSCLNLGGVRRGVSLCCRPFEVRGLSWSKPHTT